MAPRNRLRRGRREKLDVDSCAVSVIDYVLAVPLMMGCGQSGEVDLLRVMSLVERLELKDGPL
jgi:hypothetical protein